jgi:hypothetical protein
MTTIRETIESLEPRPRPAYMSIQNAITILEIASVVTPRRSRVEIKQIEEQIEAALDDLRRALIDPEFRAELHERT